MRRTSVWRPWQSIGLPVALVLSAAVAGAQPATITGRVTAQANGTPLPDSRVVVVGTTLVTTTAADGRYTLRNVPAGNVEVRVLRVGYQEQKKPVSATPNGIATLDFALATSVVQLAEIVTTATGQERRIENGQSIATIKAPDVQVAAGTINTVTDLLTGKAPGVTVLPGAMTGTAPVIRLRGVNSISLGNSPIWIVDGVRFNAGTVGVSTGGQSTTLLNSLNSEDIQNVEIVKGPAAATLYGTDAANGVILVTTKRGRAGNAQWTYYAEGGLIKDHGDYPTSYAIWGHTPANPNVQTRCELTTIATGACIKDSVTSLNIIKTDSLTPIQTGDRRQAGVQVSGGVDKLRFFLSGDGERETGPIKLPDVDVARFNAQNVPIRDEWNRPEQLQRVSGRANLNAAVNDKFDLNIQSSVVKTDQRLTQTDNNTFSIFYQSMMNPGFIGNGLGRTDTDALGQKLYGNNNFTDATIFQRYVEEDIYRILASANANYRPYSWLSADATLGTDLADRRDYTLCRRDECPPSGTTRQGTVSSASNNNRNISARLTSTATWQAKDWLNLQTSVGGEYTNIQSDGSSGNSTNLPPGFSTVGAGATQFGGNTLPSAVKTLGYYVQERFGIRDRLFLTAAVRTDKNSAFGVDYGNAIYPSFQGSYVISDESFFPKPSWLSSLRLRAAYGKAGTNPGATTALATFSASTVNYATTQAIAGTDTPGLRANQNANNELKPEVTTEVEGGIEGRLFGDRVNFDVGGFQRRSQDALINQPYAPSTGASDLNPTRNLGSIQNRGFEASVGGTVVNFRQFSYDVTFTGSYIRNKIRTLGFDATGKPTATIGTGTLRDSVGFPVDAYFYRKYTYNDANGDGYIVASEILEDTTYRYIGSSQPITTISMSNGFGLFNNLLRISSQFDLKADFYVLNNNSSFLCSNQPATSDRSNLATSLKDQARCVAARSTTSTGNLPFTTAYGYLEKGNFVRWRELSATFSLPQRYATRIRAERAQLSLAGRNLAVWSKTFTGQDPEANYNTGNNALNLASSSPRSYYTLRLNLYF